MFWLIYVWFFFLTIVTYFNRSIQKFYLIVEQPSTLYPRRLPNLGYLEKLFLSLFHRKRMFSSTIAHIFDETEIFEYRKKYYPTIFCYHIFLEKAYFENKDLIELVKIYKFLRRSSFIKKFVMTKNIFDLVENCTNHRKREFNNFMFFLVYDDVIKNYFYSNIDYLYFENFLNENRLEYIYYSFTLLLKCNKYLYFFNMEYYQDWYEFTFNDKLIIKHKKAKFSAFNRFIKKLLKEEIEANEKKHFYYYHLKYKLVKPILTIKMKLSKALRKILTKHDKIILLKKPKKSLREFFVIHFKDSSNIKNISYKNIKNYVFMYIRKNRIFNKGRYSRNRQLYRTGVYWCLWLNVIIVYGLYFLFYRFSFNFGYIWLGMGILILSTILGRVLKYNFHNLIYLKNEVIFFKNWLSYLILNFVEILEKVFNYVTGFTIYWILYRNKRKYLSNKNNFYKFYMYIYSYIFNFFKSVKKSKRIYIWQYMLEKDDSVLKYKTVFHIIKQIYRSITY